MSFVKVAEASDIPIGKMRSIKINNKEILIANVNGKYYAIGNRCTHRGGDLSKGSLENSVVTCPLHGAKFDVTTGKAISEPKIGPIKVKTNDELIYEVKVEGNEIMIKLS
ncbi:MAG: Rieske (2Fe-2S) protein [Candidatus Bathycorpusculaceae bacterium]